MSEPIAEEIDDKFIARSLADKSRTYWVAAQPRLGFMTLAGLVEYTYFHPIKGPNRNEDFLFYVVFYCGLEHRMFGVPKEFEPGVNEIANILKLKVRLGAPTVRVLGDPSPMTLFPGAIQAAARRPNLYTVSGGDPQIFNNDPILNRQIKEREGEILDLLMEYGPIITPEEAAARLWRKN